MVTLWSQAASDSAFSSAISGQLRRGALFGGLLKVWPVLIFLVPGMIGWALHQKGLLPLPMKVVDGVSVAEDSAGPGRSAQAHANARQEQVRGTRQRRRLRQRPRSRPRRPLSPSGQEPARHGIRPEGFPSGPSHVTATRAW